MNWDFGVKDDQNKRLEENKIKRQLNSVVRPSVFALVVVFYYCVDKIMVKSILGSLFRNLIVMHSSMYKTQKDVKGLGAWIMVNKLIILCLRNLTFLRSWTVALFLTDYPFRSLHIYTTCKEAVASNNSFSDDLIKDEVDLSIGNYRELFGVSLDNLGPDIWRCLYGWVFRTERHVRVP
ncbi:zinc finger protein CONSTANS-LIKE 10, partial [Striga asiatica]